MLIYMNKRDFLLNLANGLLLNQNFMTGPDLATTLNANGFQTSYGTPYAGGRGIYTLIHAFYNWLEANGRSNDARTVALAFITPAGEYAYDK